MGLTEVLIISLIVGFVGGILIKLLFNKITGNNAFDFSDLGSFFGIIIACAVITFLLFTVSSCESCVNNCIAENPPSYR